MFNKVSHGVYIGEFNNHPSRSGRATITVVLTTSEVDECFYCIRHHEGEFTFCGSRISLVADLTTQLETEENPDYRDGLQVICSEVSRIMTEYYDDLNRLDYRLYIK